MEIIAQIPSALEQVLKEHRSSQECRHA